MTDSGEPTRLSVVVPVRNGADTLGQQLDALVAAKKPAVRFEVVVADNGSTDQTVAVAESFVDRLPIRVVDASDVVGPGATRNRGVAESVGDWILFCDGDDEVDGGWLVEMSECFEAGHTLIGGPIDYERLNSPDVVNWRGSRRAGVALSLGFLPFAHTANVAVTRAVFDAVGGFDEQMFPAAEDIDFSWRVQLAGYQLHEAPAAIVHYRLRDSLPRQWIQAVSYGRSEVLLFRRHKSNGLRRRPVATLALEIWWILSRLPFAWPLARRGAWLRRLGAHYGRIVGSVKLRTLWW